MKRKGLAAALYVVLVFLSGSVVGVFGYRLYTVRSVSASVAPSKPADYRKRYVDDMTKRLNLSTEQVTELGAILDDTRARYHEEHDRSKQQLAQIHNDQVQKVKEILKPDQIPSYDTFRAEREKERQARDRANKERQGK